MIATKISQPLAESLAKPDDGKLLDIVVEIAAPDLNLKDTFGASQAERIASRKAAFAREADPLVAAIRRMGGEVTGHAWISGSLRARVSRAAVPALSDDTRVAHLDVPRPIERDSKAFT